MGTTHKFILLYLPAVDVEGPLLPVALVPSSVSGLSEAARLAFTAARNFGSALMSWACLAPVFFQQVDRDLWKIWKGCSMGWQGVM